MDEPAFASPGWHEIECATMRHRTPATLVLCAGWVASTLSLSSTRLLAQHLPAAASMNISSDSLADLQCEQYGPEAPAEIAMRERAEQDALDRRQALLQRLAAMAERHALRGTASYYSTFFHGRKTANREIYRNDRFSAAHLTLPLGCWVEVRCLATGKKIRLRVNDRGPYTGGFVLDLSQAAAREIGVDRTEDRRVEIKVIAMPGEEPFAEEEMSAE